MSDNLLKLLRLGYVHIYQDDDGPYILEFIPNGALEYRSRHLRVAKFDIEGAVNAMLQYIEYPP